MLLMPVPLLVNVAIPVLASTVVTVIVKLLAGVAPPIAAPNTTRVSPGAYPEPGETNVGT